MDTKLPILVNIVLSILFQVVISVVFIAVIVPWFLVVLPVIAAAFVMVYVVFWVGVRRLQRFRLESMAPLLTHVDATVHGLSSLHAYERVDDFRTRLMTCRYIMIYDCVKQCDRLKCRPTYYSNSLLYDSSVFTARCSA